MEKTLLSYLPHNYAPFFRGLHIAIALLIAGQIVNSNFIDASGLDEQDLTNIITWLHVVSGSLLLLLGTVLLGWMLTQRGVRWYYAWIFFDFSQIHKDTRQLRHFSLPDAERGGIAATIQGLGVLSLLLVAASGMLWFMAARFLSVSPSQTYAFLHWHKFLTTFIEIYFYGHGFMGLLHIFMTSRKKSSDQFRSAR